MRPNRPTDLELLFVQRRIHDSGRRGFTLTDLLATLAGIGILALLLSPALAATQPGTKAFQCLNNMRQLAQAWTLYAGDNHDKLAINNDPHVNGSSYFNGTPSWISGVLDWSSGFYNTNTAYLTDERYSSLGGYLGRSAKVFACPATATFVSPSQRSLGWSARCRSVVMNAAVGDGHKYQEPHPYAWTNWYVARKSTDFRTPRPSSVWVFSDEHPDSIDDYLMYTANYATTVFTELPGSQHEAAGGVAFADGHSEIHKWQGKAARQPVQFSGEQGIPCLINDPDILWLAQHTPQN